MGKLNFNEVEQHILLKSLLFQKADLQKQLDEVEGLIQKCKGDTYADSNVISITRKTRSTSDNQLNEKMIEVLNEANSYLTSREVLEAIKRKYEDVRALDKPSERKYMANLSARLTKGFSDGKIDRIKEEGKDAIYGIKKGQQIAAP